jgi:hypothetical protein
MTVVVVVLGDIYRFPRAMFRLEPQRLLWGLVALLGMLVDLLGLDCITLLVEATGRISLFLPWSAVPVVVVEMWATVLLVLLVKDLLAVILQAVVVVPLKPEALMGLKPAVTVLLLL